MNVAGHSAWWVPIVALGLYGVVVSSSAADSVIPLPEKEPPGVEAVSTSKSQLEEIIVTAQRRAQDMQDVPIAMNVMSGGEIERSGITDTGQLMRYLPNVTGDADVNSFFVRGLGTPRTSLVGEQSVAYMIDEAYVARMEFLRGGLLDIENVQLLKGPQGTLFGRNSPAGVMIQTSRAPGYEWDGHITAAYGSRHLTDVRGAFGGPMVDDRLAFRLAAAFHRQHGAGENLSTGNRFGDREDIKLRGRLLFEPSANLRIDLIGNYFSYLYGNWIFGEPYEIPPEWALPFSLVDPNYEGDLDRRISAPIDPEQDGQGHMASLKADWSLADHSLISVSAYSHFASDNQQDADAVMFPIIDFFTRNDYTQFTQELRLESPPGRFEYVAGVFYMHSELFNFWTSPLLNGAEDIFAGRLTELADALLGTGLPIQGLVDRLTDPLTSPNLLRDENISEMDITADSYAVYSQVQYRLFDPLTLIGGARYTLDRNRLVGSNRPVEPDLLWTLLLAGKGYDADIDRRSTNFSPKLALTYELFRNVTLYASYAEGYRSGSFNHGAFSLEQVEFQPESSRNYELGAKSELFDRRLRLNVGAYHSTFKDYQLFTFTGVTFVVDNAPKMRSRGVEMDFTALLAEGLTLAGGVAYNDAIWVDYPEGPCVTKSLLAPGGIPFNNLGLLPPQLRCDLSGERVFHAPRWTGSLRLDFSRQLFDWPVILAVGVDSTFRSLEHLDPDLDPIDTQSAHALFNGRLGIRHINGGWELLIRGENLTDKTIKRASFDMPIAFGAHNATLNSPRAISASVRWSF